MIKAKDLREVILETSFNISDIEPISGGDINEAYCLYCDNKKYFLKVNDAARYPDMFKKEAGGLKALRRGSSLVIPEVIQCGTVNSRQYLVLEWLEKGSAEPHFWKEFGHGLAAMHKIPQPFFGFDEDNYIGSLPQKNHVNETWSDFYRDCRIMPFVKKLIDAGSFSSADIESAEHFCKRISDIFPPEPPALLHGDLWGGNYMITQNGAASIYDPAVYYGHREMDLGMTLLFGGFSQQLYDFYSEVYPLEKNWRQRVRYTQFYPLLVHAILFGGHYVGSVREILKEF